MYYHLEARGHRLVLDSRKRQRHDEFLSCETIYQAD